MLTVGSATELGGVPGNFDDTDEVAILLAEHCNRPHLPGVCDGYVDVALHALVGEHVLVHFGLDSLEHFAAQCVIVMEVEAKLVLVDE